jgi:hypothetical protein
MVDSWATSLAVSRAVRLYVVVFGFFNISLSLPASIHSVVFCISIVTEKHQVDPCLPLCPFLQWLCIRPDRRQLPVLPLPLLPLLPLLRIRLDPPLL